MPGSDNEGNLDFDVLQRLARTDPKAFETLARRLKEDFITKAPIEMQSDLRSMQEDIDGELSQCKTFDERMKVILKRLDALYEYARNVRDGTAPICVKFPNISLNGGDSGEERGKKNTRRCSVGCLLLC